jgi:hypothetical protein
VLSSCAVPSSASRVFCEGVCVRESVCVSVCVYVCVRERERGGERKSDSVCVCVCVCVFVCVLHIKSVCVRKSAFALAVAGLYLGNPGQTPALALR